jgi:hypothetical protein
MPKATTVLIVIASLGAAAALYGIVTGLEASLAAGLALTFIALLMIPVLNQRAKKKRRFMDRRDALLVWEYAAYETQAIAADAVKKVRKTSLRLSISFSVCLAIIFTPFVALTKTGEVRFLILFIGILAVLLPFSSLCFAPAYTSSLIRRIPSLSIIGRDYILMNNRYLGINDRADLKLKTASVVTRGGGAVLTLVYTFRAKYGGRIEHIVEVPIPGGRLDEAKRFADSHQAQRN